MDTKPLPNPDKAIRKQDLARKRERKLDRILMRSADKSTEERGLARKQLQNLDRDNKKDSLARITPQNLDRIMMRSIGKLTEERGLF